MRTRKDLELKARNVNYKSFRESCTLKLESVSILTLYFPCLSKNERQDGRYKGVTPWEGGGLEGVCVWEGV